MISIYNSLTKKVQELTPLKDNMYRIYSCGLTLYDNAHLGNLSSFIYVDTLNRIIEINKYPVHHVMNFTDIDDKTIKRSAIEYPDDTPGIALQKLTNKYAKGFYDDMNKIGNRNDRFKFIKATDSIEEMQKLILRLYNNKFAYIADDGIYFSIEAYVKSGKKYGQLVEINTDNTSKERINNDEYDKNSAHDFSLWKFKKNNDPAWSFIIDGKDYIGRPGWHIECSAMSRSSLGQPFDIHTGGIDLIFPHHENEIAQSTALEHNPIFAKSFVHNEHMLINNRKMSKSEGNTYRLKDLIDRNFDPLAFRLLVLQSHYRSRSEFNFELLAAAQSRLLTLRNISALQFQVQNNKSDDLEIDYKKYIQQITNAISLDLNTPRSLAILSEWENLFENHSLTNSDMPQFQEFINFLDLIFGLNLSNIIDIDNDIKILINEREEARRSKNFSRSDELREQIKRKNIGVRDTIRGPIWFRLI